MNVHSLGKMSMGAVLLWLLFPLTGCDDQSDSNKNRATDGVWQSRGYGMLVQVEGNHVTTFETSSVHCLPTGTDSLYSLGTVALNKDKDMLTVTHDGGVTQYDFDRLPSLPQACKKSSTTNPTDDITNFDILWQTFKEQYAYFDLHSVDWDAVRQTYRPQVGTRDLFDIFSDMLTPLRDGHITLYGNDKLFFPGEAVLLSRLPHLDAEIAAQPGIVDAQEYFFSIINDSFGIVSENYLAPQTIQMGANEQLLWGRLSDHPNIGYLTAFSMIQWCANCGEAQEVTAAESTMADALMQLGAVSTLIVDMRFNTGGYDSVAKAMAEYLTRAPHIGFIKKAVDGAGFTRDQTVFLEGNREARFAGNIILLTSPLTASAAEVFCLMVKDQPNVLHILGERTWGIFSDMLPKTLPNGWEFSLSNEIYTDAFGQNFEGIGIPPDEIITPFTKSDRDSGTDTILERAIVLSGENEP